MSRPALVLVAALDRAGAIGRHGALPWQLPDDLTRFKSITAGRPLLMGRHTAVSLGRALPGRRNLVLTRSGEVPYPSMVAVASLEAALALVEAPELMVIGGAQVYRLCLPLADRMHLSHVDTTVSEPDTWFPEIDEDAWVVRACERHEADARHAHAFEYVDYERAPARVPR